MIIGTSDSRRRILHSSHAVETGKHQIEDYQVRNQVAGHAQAGLAVMSDLGVESRTLEVHLDPVCDPRIVFDYQYRAAHRRSLQ